MWHGALGTLFHLARVHEGDKVGGSGEIPCGEAADGKKTWPVIYPLGMCRGLLAAYTLKTSQRAWFRDPRGKLPRFGTGCSERESTLDLTDEALVEMHHMAVIDASSWEFQPSGDETGKSLR